MRTELVIAAMLALVLFWNRGNAIRQGYACPQCGTRRPKEHSKDCAWR